MMLPAEEIAACRQDLTEIRRRLDAGEIGQQEADDMIGMAQRRIDYLEGRGSWYPLQDVAPPAAYTTWGSVRGCCGHEHATLQQAQGCLDRDLAGCDRQGGYSDREIRHVTPGEWRNYDVTRGPGRFVLQEEDL